MHTANVRELKKNPSRALRLAKEGPVLILKGNEPDAVLVHLAKSLKDTESGVRPGAGGQPLPGRLCLAGQGSEDQRPFLG